MNISVESLYQEIGHLFLINQVQAREIERLNQLLQETQKQSAPSAPNSTDKSNS